MNTPIGDTNQSAPDPRPQATLQHALALLERALPLLVEVTGPMQHSDLANATDHTGASIDQLRSVLGLPERDPDSEPSTTDQAHRDGLSLPEAATSLLVAVANAWRVGDDGELMKLGAAVNQLAEEYALPGLVSADVALEWDEEGSE